jgi:hypothetical protein
MMLAITVYLEMNFEKEAKVEPDTQAYRRYPAGG